MPEPEGYSPRNRAERVISAARLFVAALLTVAIFSDLTNPPRFAPEVRALALSYLLYAVAVAILTWSRRITARGVPMTTHVIDLLVYSAFIFLTDGADSPFFPYLVFATICGAIRWYGKGAALTGAVALVLYAAATLGGEARRGGTDFQSAEFMARCTQLALVAGLVGYLGAYQRRLHREIGSLAAWPRRLPTLEPEALEEVLTYAAGVLRCSRVVLVWEEEDEPSLRLAERSAGSFNLSRERPDVFGQLVAEPLERSSFVATGLGRRRQKVLQRVPGGFRFWQGTPLSPAFLDRYNTTDVVALRLAADSVGGWLFVLDKPRALEDDLLLGDIVGRLIGTTLELYRVVGQLQETAAGEERIRLARDLHDGVLQSLTAASLQAQRARQSLTSSPEEAGRRLAMVEDTIFSEQQSLRNAIRHLQPGAVEETESVDVIPRLRDTATQVARQWDIRVHLNLQQTVPPLPRRTAHELARMLREALVNAIRHGQAREATVTCIMMNEELALSVSYRGKGFANLPGRHDLSALTRMKAGPRTLKERVAAVGGELVIESHERGARVEIRIRPTALR